LGVDSSSRLTTLTTDFHEFIGQVTKENQAVLQYGPFFQWSEKVRKDNPVPSGPLNPQALNRYSYGLNNPVKYQDPSGHAAICDCDGIGLGGIFEAYRYWNDRPDDLRMALKSFFEAHPDYDLNLAAEGKDGFRSGLREGDWSDAAFSQMWVGMERGGWNEASKYFAVVGVAGAMAEGNGPNAEGLNGLIGTGGLAGANNYSIAGRSVAALAGDTAIRPGLQGVVDNSYVEKSAKAMSEGSFDWNNMKDRFGNPDPLVFLRAPDGSLTIENGHHRFLAAQMTGTSIPFDNPLAVQIKDVEFQYPAGSWGDFKWSGY
jgi:hypothetical protein